MSGPRHSAGSTSSNGGGSSPSNRVIVGRRPFSIPWGPSLGVRRAGRALAGPGSEAFCETALSAFAAVLPSKKVFIASGTLLGPPPDAWFYGPYDAIRSRNDLAKGPFMGPSFTRSLPSVGLSECIDPALNWIDLLAMHKILLAEDDNDMRRFLVKALENAGFQVSHHDNGMSAYQRLREEPFEMLLTDIVMPEMDGIELARRASELDPDIKIMFITGFAAVALNSDSEAPKNAKVLSKPVHLRELVSEVNKMLAA